MLVCRLEADYSHTAAVEKLLSDRAEVISRDYGEGAIYHFRSPDDLTESIREITAGTGKLEIIGQQTVETELQ